MIAACEGTSHSFTVVSSEHDRTCVWSREENFVTCTGCLCESKVRRIARETVTYGKVMPIRDKITNVGIENLYMTQPMPGMDPQQSEC